MTRKIIRKCVSADGVEREEVSLEGAPQGSINMAEGDGYSKVVKRTVLKSEGDHTEVCVCTVYYVCVRYQLSDTSTFILVVVYKGQLNNKLMTFSSDLGNIC